MCALLKSSGIVHTVVVGVFDGFFLTSATVTLFNLYIVQLCVVLYFLCARILNSQLKFFDFSNI